MLSHFAAKETPDSLNQAGIRFGDYIAAQNTKITI